MDNWYEDEKKDTKVTEEQPPSYESAVNNQQPFPPFTNQPLTLPPPVSTSNPFCIDTYQLPTFQPRTDHSRASFCSLTEVSLDTLPENGNIGNDNIDVTIKGNIFIKLGIGVILCAIGIIVASISTFSDDDINDFTKPLAGVGTVASVFTVFYGLLTIGLKGADNSQGIKCHIGFSGAVGCLNIGLLVGRIAALSSSKQHFKEFILIIFLVFEIVVIFVIVILSIRKIKSLHKKGRQQRNEVLGGFARGQNTLNATNFTESSTRDDQA